MRIKGEPSWACTVTKGLHRRYVPRRIPCCIERIINQDLHLVADEGKDKLQALMEPTRTLRSVPTKRAIGIKNGIKKNLIGTTHYILLNLVI